MRTGSCDVNNSTGLDLSDDVHLRAERMINVVERAEKEHK